MSPLEAIRAATAVAAPVLAPFDPTVILQPIEQAGERRFFDAHPLRDFLLGKFVSALRKVDQRPPFALAQAERAQALIKLRAPGARRAEEQKTELVDVGRRHLANWLAC
jgi:hypothetical protein